MIGINRHSSREGDDCSIVQVSHGTEVVFKEQGKRGVLPALVVVVV